jgi:hypothetical protein
MNYTKAKAKIDIKTANFCGICKVKVCVGDAGRLSYTKIDGSTGWVHSSCVVKSLQENIFLAVSDRFDEEIKAVEDAANKKENIFVMASLIKRHDKLMVKKYQGNFMFDSNNVHKHFKDLIAFNRKISETETLETILDRCEISAYQEIEILLKTNKVWFEKVLKVLSVISAMCDVCTIKLQIRRKLFDPIRIEQIKEEMKGLRN